MRNYITSRAWTTFLIVLMLQPVSQNNKLRVACVCRVINYVSKRVSGTANTLGSVAVVYSALGCLLYWGRGSKEDSANTLLAGSLTGEGYESLCEWVSWLRYCIITVRGRLEGNSVTVLSILLDYIFSSKIAGSCKQSRANCLSPTQARSTSLRWDCARQALEEPLAWRWLLPS